MAKRGKRETKLRLVIVPRQHEISKSVGALYKMGIISYK